ncbi:hypothetical protein Q0Z83_031020 [Actinoplanes sichuanensis]|uniref:Leucine rich repeat variant n=1 Tax=Actinoplanes sichuanensis TaxID=512349 RepID=A0ABW4AQN1_9ACTN|nr:hypothetical protein [Actinoplanes sichuanensis]BEL04911.1 hypothetical protein Q0Z83_031020 [Actinoplanes sichuanensis]
MTHTRPRPPADRHLTRGLAANPGLSIDVLRPLADSDDEQTRQALARRTDLTEDLAVRLATGPPVGRSATQAAGPPARPATVQAAIPPARPAAAQAAVPPVRLAAAQAVVLAGNPVAAAHAWPQLITHPDPSARRALAAHAPSPALRILAHDPDLGVRRAVAVRPDLPGDLVLQLAADPSPIVRREIAWHPHRPHTLLTDRDDQVRRSALMRVAPPDDLLPALLADPATRPVAARHVHDPGRAAALRDDPDPWVRSSLAENDHLPYRVVSPLGTDGDEEVRTAIMLRRDTPDDVRHTIAATLTDQDTHVSDWLRPQRATRAERLAHLRSPFVFHRRAIAFSTDLPAEAVAALAADDDYSVRLLTARNSPGVPGHILPGLLRRAGHDRWELAAHPNMPAASLAALATGDDEELRQVAAAAPNLPPRLAAALLTDRHHQTRCNAAANPALPLPLLRQALHGPDRDLARHAARNPALPVPDAQKIITAHGTVR